jgi:hypothetical protein
MDENIFTKTTEVAGVPVIMYSRDSIHWSSSVKLLDKWQRKKEKEQKELQRLFKREKRAGYMTYNKRS